MTVGAGGAVVLAGGVDVGEGLAVGLPPGERDGDGAPDGDALALGDAEGDGHGPSFDRTFDHGKRP